MTTELNIDSATQAELEAWLAAQTTPCPVCNCGCGCHSDKSGMNWRGCCDDLHSDHDAYLCPDEVPLIERSRRGCQCQTGIDVCVNCMDSDAEDYHVGWCLDCSGLDYVPDLDMKKVIRYMQSHRVVRFAEIRRGLTTVTWGLIEEEDPDPYLALLRACAKGVEVMNNAD